MKTLNVATEAQIDAPYHVERGLILFDLVSGQYAFWEGNEPLVWNLITWGGNGQILELDFGEETTGTESNGFSVTLRENPGLSFDVLKTIFSENYHLRPVTVWKAWFDPNTRAMAGQPVVFRRGIISTIEAKEDSGGRYIVGTCETTAALHTRRGWAKATQAEQQAVSAGDMFFEFTGIAGVTRMPFGTRLDSKFSSSGSGGNPL